MIPAVTIDARLPAIAKAQPYPLLFATVSGAHLYGFPSPDSDFDLRGTDFRMISGLGSLAGLVVDDYQLTLLAPLLAAHLGVVVA